MNVEGGVETRKLELSTLEKTVIAGLSSVILMLLGWLAYTTNQTATQVAVINNTIAAIQRDQARGDALLYSRGEADAEHRLIGLRLDAIERRIGADGLPEMRR